MSVDDKVEEYDVLKAGPHGEYEHRERIVEDERVSRRQLVDRLVQLIWLLAGLLEALLGLRFLLKLMAANTASPFAQLMYNFTNLFMWPFNGLTITPKAGGMILETPVLIAMIVYALLAWALVKMVGIVLSPTRSRSVTVFERRKE